MNKIYEDTMKMNHYTEVQSCFSNISAHKYPSKMVQYSKRAFLCQVSNETDPNHGSLFIFGKIKQNPLCNVLMCIKKIAPWSLPDFSRNRKPPWLESVSFETWHPKVRFEYWTIFEGYLRAEIFQKQLCTFGQSLIFNVFSYIFKIKVRKLWSFLLILNVIICTSRAAEKFIKCPCIGLRK